MTLQSMPVPKEISEPSLASVLDRIVRDPSVPLERMQQVLNMLDSREDRDQQRHAKQSYAEAMAAAQEEMSTISTDSGNPQTRSRYASLAAIDRAIRPIYTKHRMYLSFNTEDSPKGETWIKITCELAHRDGYSRGYALDMPADGKGARGNDVMTRTHATMSAVTYGRRGLLKMIFNLAEDDDDGNAAGKKPPQAAPNVMVKPAVLADGRLYDRETGEITESVEEKAPLQGVPSSTLAGAAPSVTTTGAALPIHEMAREAARRGDTVFRTFWRNRSAKEQDDINQIGDELRRIMDEASKEDEADDGPTS